MLPHHALLIASLSMGTLAFGAPPQQVPSSLPKPAARDLCPVCGMLVSKYPAWVATVLYQDGQAHHFDGAKDLFKYLQDPAKYAQGRQPGAIRSLAVTEFYGLKKIDARTAWYVLGSNVLGPMGPELVPLATRADAEEFMKDHRGDRVLRFEQVSRDILLPLDH